MRFSEKSLIIKLKIGLNFERHQNTFSLLFSKKEGVVADILNKKLK